VPLTDDPLIENFLQQQRQRYRDQAVSEAPAMHPLAVNDVVLMRTIRNLLAVDFGTGKRLWEVPVEDHLDQILSANGETIFQQAPQVPIGLSQRCGTTTLMGLSAATGTTCSRSRTWGWLAGCLSRGRCSCGGGGCAMRRAQDLQPSHGPRHPDGKAEVARRGPDDRFALRQSEAFFLGPPLPVSGSSTPWRKSKTRFA